MTSCGSPRRRLALVTAGMFGALALGTLVHIAATTASPADRHQIGATGQERAPASAQSSAAEVAQAECHLSAARFAVDEGSPNRLWAELRNVGTTPVTLWAIEVGWRSQAVLEAVLVRRAGDDSVHPVRDGPATSPALLFLAPTEEATKTLVLAAGETAQLGLQFGATVGERLLTSLGPAVIHTREGCAVGIGVQGDVDLRCQLTVEPAAVSAAVPDLVEAVAINNGSETLALAAVELAWPATNGALVGMTMDGQELIAFDPPVASSPAVIDLRRLGAPAVTLPAGGRRTIGFRFANAAVSEPYVVSLTAHGGCAATSTTWLKGASTDCGVRPIGFEIHGDTVQLRLANRRPVTRTLTTVGLFWPVVANGPLAELRLNGGLAWRGEEADSPAALRLTGAVLPPDTTAELQLVFTGTLRSSLAMKGGSGGDYTVVADFQGGCQVVFSTIAGRPAGCSLSAGETILHPETREVTTRLTSLADDAVLRVLSVKWPDRNGALTGVWLDRAVLFSGREPASAKPFDIRLAGRSAVVPRSQSRDLRLRFADRVTRGGYALSLTFEDPLGAPCELLVQSAPEQPECRLSLGRLKTDLRDVLVPLRNEGRDEVEIRYLDADWPSDRLNGLAQVALLREPGGQVQLVWSAGAEQPIRTRPPVRIVPNSDTSPVVDGGITTTLRFRFTDLMDPEEVTQRFRLTVAAVEGCVATYAPDGSQLPAQRERFGGVIRQLPRSRPGQNGLFGIWRIDTERGERLVQVDAQTRFNPTTVTPAEGDVVMVQALRTDDDRLLAEEITFRNTGKATTLIGTIDAMDTEAPPPKWIDVRMGSEVQNVRLTATTVVEGELAVGASVTVDGVASPTGGVVASRVRVTQPPRGEFVLLRGIVQQAEAGATAGEQNWIVDKYQVRVPRAYAPELVPAGSLPPPGQRVEVYGRLTGREMVLVQRARLLPMPVQREVRGFLIELPPNSLIGQWVVESPEAGRIPFLVDRLALVDTSIAPADRGLWVEATVQETGGTPVAVRVRMDWQP